MFFMFTMAAEGWQAIQASDTDDSNPVLQDFDRGGIAPDKILKITANWIFQWLVSAIVIICACFLVQEELTQLYCWSSDISCNSKVTVQDHSNQQPNINLQ